MHPDAIITADPTIARPLIAWAIRRMTLDEICHSACSSAEYYAQQWRDGRGKAHYSGYAEESLETARAALAVALPALPTVLAAQAARLAHCEGFVLDGDKFWVEQRDSAAKNLARWKEWARSARDLAKEILPGEALLAEVIDEQCPGPVSR